MPYKNDDENARYWPEAEIEHWNKYKSKRLEELI